ncbi:MAG TPA: flagellin [Microvirga sp.]|jgi:flagellin-like hook-associated protein FlgL|nr:flagellin [Microvirga sp.]
MAGITLSAGVRQNLAALQSTSALQSLTQNRLATGKKVNSALDNPSSFFTASGLNNRAGDLGTLLDDMGQAVKTLQAADKAIGAISKLVDNAKSIAKQAQAAPDDVAASAAVPAVVNGTGASATPASNSRLDLTVGGVSFSVNLTTAMTTTANLVTAINSAATTAGAAVTASDQSGTLRLTSTDADGSDSIIVQGTSEAAALTATRLTAGTTAGTAAVEASTKRATLKSDLDGIVAQINELASDAGYNGVNLVTGDNLKVTFNETGKSKLDIAGKNLKADGLGINSLALATDANIESTLKSLKTASDTLRSQAATFGANLSVVQNRQDFTKAMIDTLNNGADELTNADTNQEAANLLSLQTRAQLANTALSMASQQDQGVLRLF